MVYFDLIKIFWVKILDFKTIIYAIKDKDIFQNNKSTFFKFNLKACVDLPGYENRCPQLASSYCGKGYAFNVKNSWVDFDEICKKSCNNPNYCNGL